jgi:hypothetical protein
MPPGEVGGVLEVRRDNVGVSYDTHRTGIAGGQPRAEAKTGHRSILGVVACQASPHEDPRNMQPPSHQDTKLISSLPPESLDRPLNATYVRVVVVEAAIIVLLWLFGMMFS